MIEIEQDEKSTTVISGKELELIKVTYVWKKVMAANSGFTDNEKQEHNIQSAGGE